MTDYAGKQSRSPNAYSAGHAAQASPGKRTLVEQAYPLTVQQQASASDDPGAATRATGVGVVQRRADGQANADVHAAATRGLESPATSIPFADRIQASFGTRYNVAAMQAHVGGAASEAASAMGASAYAMGNHAVFSSAPDLHTAAHEAAHVVQQRQGVSLYGGVGQVGDRYEQHADAVADRVVAGQSAAELLDAAVSTGQTATGAVQRKTEQEMDDHEKALAKIQGYPMDALLTALDGVGDAKADFNAGQSIGGPRLVAAMKAVAVKGTDWMSYANANHGDMGSLPDDQIKAIMAYIGAPKDARYYKDIPGKKRGKFDGAVDPASQTITLFYRAKLAVGGPEQGVTAHQHLVSDDALRQFAPKFKAAIEKVWSGGHIKPAQAIGGVSQFTIKTNIAVVTGGEHMIFYVAPEELGSSFVAKDASFGKLRESANDEKSWTCGGTDPTGKHPVTMTNTQQGSTHEFGHAVGLDHPRSGGYDGQLCDPAYGVTEEERGSVMGAGHEMRVIKRGGIEHNDYAPFISIGEKWGSEILPASLASRNKWSVA